MDQSVYNFTGSGHETDAKHLFEESAWLYAFCREHLFRDHTEEIARALFPNGSPAETMTMLEVGCGPGFYACRLARRYPSLRVLGIDRSSRLVTRARCRASSDQLTNCSFQQGDVESLSVSVGTVDAIVSSRLLLVVANRRAVLAEMFQALKPGGRLFLAEPTSNFKTQLPLSLMRLATYFIRPAPRKTLPQTAEVLSSQDFKNLVQSQPWGNVTFQTHNDYQCAICERGVEPMVDHAASNISAMSLPAGGSRSLL